ncbi:MAG: KpsF/GutQ family sugar-phosphate isomerase [Flavisolibacter sp.]|nr:KpsF/GutQ family sugar-phosphate isomerase [Flavisolibacter sp.]
MNNLTDIKRTAIRTIELEAEAVSSLIPQLDDTFDETVEAIAACQGRLVVSGIGKSAIIAQKIVATLNSTGSPSIFLHAADAIHGDLGIIQKSDVVIIISKSGESPEIKVLVPLIKNFGNILVGMVGNISSFLAKKADFVLNTTVSQEACPNNLAPTTSTTAQLAMGDAIAVCLLEKRGFEISDFAKLNPGGALGKKLYLRVSDLCSENEKPVVAADQSVKEVIMEITRNRLGVTAVVNAAQKLIGVVTDGDIRRMLEKTDDIKKIVAKDIMTMNPKTIGSSEMAVTALDMMRQNSITQLIVIDGEKYVGVVHLHDLIKEGLI